jgi:hypothetical protein
MILHWTLTALYFAIGLTCAGLVLFSALERDARVVGSALASIVLWPLWAPFAFAAHAAPPRGPLASRIALALDVTLLNRSETALLLRQVELAERRLGELDAQLATLRGGGTELVPASPDASARAELRATSHAQLEALRQREHGALLELTELCELLRAQHLLTRFGGAERVGELRDELWARVQALSELSG